MAISLTTKKDIFYSLNLTLADFEDALQVAAAKACIAEKIVTRNIKHYKNSPIPVQTPTTFIRDIIYIESDNEEDDIYNCGRLDRPVII